MSTLPFSRDTVARVTETVCHFNQCKDNPPVIVVVVVVVVFGGLN